MVHTREQLLVLLREQIVTVKFNKMDGTERVMHCTLSEEYIVGQFAESNNVVEEKKKVDNPNRVNVWDVDKNGWRSFLMDSVIEVLPGPVLLNE